jgi:hypothetical protein
MSHTRPRILVVSGVAVLVAGLVALLGGCNRSAVTVAPPVAVVAQQQAAAPAEEAPAPARADAAPGDGFRFPDDHGGEMLGKLLTPSTGPLPGEDDAGPRRFGRSRALVPPAPPLPPGRVEVARLPDRHSTAVVRPGPLPEGPPLADERGTPAPPEAVRLPAGERVRLPSEDVNRPVPLPPLGQPAPDRAPLDDPTADASLAAALAARMPERTTPAPFVKLDVPDPFENRHAVRLPALPPDASVPVAVASRPPKR